MVEAAEILLHRTVHTSFNKIFHRPLFNHRSAVSIAVSNMRTASPTTLTPTSPHVAAHLRERHFSCLRHDSEQPSSREPGNTHTHTHLHKNNTIQNSMYIFLPINPAEKDTPRVRPNLLHMEKNVFDYIYKFIFVLVSHRRTRLTRRRSLTTCRCRSYQQTLQMTHPQYSAVQQKAKTHVRSSAHRDVRPRRWSVRYDPPGSGCGHRSRCLHPGWERIHTHEPVLSDTCTISRVKWPIKTKRTVTGKVNKTEMIVNKILMRYFFPGCSTNPIAKKKKRTPAKPQNVASCAVTSTTSCPAYPRIQ